MLETSHLKGTFGEGVRIWIAEFFITINASMGLARRRCLRGFTGSV